MSDTPEANAEVLKNDILSQLVEAQKQVIANKFNVGGSLRTMMEAGDLPEQIIKQPDLVRSLGFITGNGADPRDKRDGDPLVGFGQNTVSRENVMTLLGGENALAEHYARAKTEVDEIEKDGGPRLEPRVKIALDNGIELVVPLRKVSGLGATADSYSILATYAVIKLESPNTPFSGETAVGLVQKGIDVWKIKALS